MTIPPRQTWQMMSQPKPAGSSRRPQSAPALRKKHLGIDCNTQATTTQRKKLPSRPQSATAQPRGIKQPKATRPNSALPSRSKPDNRRSVADAGTMQHPAAAMRLTALRRHLKGKEQKGLFIPTIHHHNRTESNFLSRQTIFCESEM